MDFQSSVSLPLERALAFLSESRAYNFIEHMLSNADGTDTNEKALVMLEILQLEFLFKGKFIYKKTVYKIFYTEL